MGPDEWIPLPCASAIGIDEPFATLSTRGGYRFEQYYNRRGRRLIASKRLPGCFYVYANKNPTVHASCAPIKASIRKQGLLVPELELSRGHVVGVVEYDDVSEVEARRMNRLGVHLVQGGSQYLVVSRCWSLKKPVPASVPPGKRRSDKWMTLTEPVLATVARRFQEQILGCLIYYNIINIQNYILYIHTILCLLCRYGLGCQCLLCLRRSG